MKVIFHWFTVVVVVMMMKNNNHGTKSILWMLILFSIIAMACGTAGSITTMEEENVYPISGKLFASGVTAEPIVTVTIFAGTTTPVYKATPVPETQTVYKGDNVTVIEMTVTPESVYVLDPWTNSYKWATATPVTQWINDGGAVVQVTVAPQIVYEERREAVYEEVTTTPPPPITTTPSLNMYVGSTPIPTEVPDYDTGSFWMQQKINYETETGKGVVFWLTEHRVVEVEPIGFSDDPDAGLFYHYFTFQVKNLTDVKGAIVPLTDQVFLSELYGPDGEYKRGRWTYSTITEEPDGREKEKHQAIPRILEGIKKNKTEEYIIGIPAPLPDARVLGVTTEVHRPIYGGLPVWIQLENDPNYPREYAEMPPLPTPDVLGESYVGANPFDSDSKEVYQGDGDWPIEEGFVIRNYGCAVFYTGVSSAGYDCTNDDGITYDWFHTGIDLGSIESSRGETPAVGEPIYATEGGRVAYIGEDTFSGSCENLCDDTSYYCENKSPWRGFGWYVKVSNGDTQQIYAHLDSFQIPADTINVEHRRLLGTMGSTGCSSEPHIHWQITRGGTPIDPKSWAGPIPSGVKDR